jgi:riboflavin kinase/FMN adenylyltransferase
MKKNCVLALGFFDSIHIGHRSLLRTAEATAEKYGAEVCALTFGDGFLKNLGRNEEEVYLLSERRHLLKTVGVGSVCVLPCGKSFVNMAKEDFLAYLDGFSPKALVAGSDYRFGKNAEGNASELKAFFEKKGVETVICDLLRTDGKKVSTSDIRVLLKNGEIEKADCLLGGEFFYGGTVIGGHENGRKYGFPTINLDIAEEKIKIKEGVYATRTEFGGKFYRSVTNVGIHPTFSDTHFNVETHVLAEIGDVYGKKARIYFVKYLRGTKCFSDGNALFNQICEDIKTAEEILKK